MNLLSFKNYRRALKAAYQEARTVKKSLSLESIAEQIQSHGSFLSNVLNEKAHVSPDQLQALCDILDLSDSDADYLDLLLQKERSTNSNRKKHLQKKIEAQFQERPKAKDSIKNVEVFLPESEVVERYYSNPFCKVVHIFLGIKNFADKPSEILEHLAISEEELSHVIQLLIELKMIERKNKTIKILRKNLHLPKEASICRPHQILMRQISQLKYQSSSKTTLETLSVTFSANEDAYKIIHKEYLNFLNLTKKIVENCEDIDSVYQMNMDLFPWTRPK